MRYSLSKYLIERDFKKAVEKALRGERPNIAQIMRESGRYSESSIRCAKLTKTKTWKECLEKIKDESLIDRLMEIALDKDDKRASIEAIKELFKLKERYPRQKLSFELFEAEISRIEAEQEETPKLEEVKNKEEPVLPKGGV